MCGIVGYIGDKQAYSILIKGIKRRYFIKVE